MDIILQVSFRLLWWRGNTVKRALLLLCHLYLVFYSLERWRFYKNISYIEALYPNILGWSTRIRSLQNPVYEWQVMQNKENRLADKIQKSVLNFAITVDVDWGFVLFNSIIYTENENCHLQLAFFRYINNSKIFQLRQNSYLAHQVRNTSIKDVWESWFAR